MLNGEEASQILKIKSKVILRPLIFFGSTPSIPPILSNQLLIKKRGSSNRAKFDEGESLLMRLYDGLQLNNIALNLLDVFQLKFKSVF